MPTPLTIGSMPEYWPTPDSPKLSPDAFALEFRVRPAVTKTGQATVALFASVRLPRQYALVYGGDARAAVEIVAINNRTGEVHHNNPEVGHTVPLSATMHPEPSAPRPGEATIDSTSFYFAVDLRAQLRLPNNSATYSVFLWLDEMISSLQMVEISGDPARYSVPASFQDGFRYMPIAATPPAESKIVLRSNGPRFAGTIGSQLLKNPIAKCLTILGLDYRSRALKWRSFDASAPLESDRGLAFEFDPAVLFGGPGWLDAPQEPRKAFLLAAMGTTFSNVVVLNA